MIAPIQTEKHYLSRDKDSIDDICWKYYGRTRGTTEAVLKRNGEVGSRQPFHLPAGVLIVLPVLDTTLPAQTVQLWNYRPEQVFTPTPTPVVDTLTAVKEALAEYNLQRGNIV